MSIVDFWRPGTWFLCLTILAGCASSPSQTGLPAAATPADVENLDAADLMQAYGALLRARVREDDRSFIESDQFKLLQREVAKRKLVTKKTSEQISQGIVFIDMPKEQMMASVDSLDVAEQQTFDRFLLKLYRGDPRGGPNVPWILLPINPFYVVGANAQKDREFFLTCTGDNPLDEKVIGFFVWGTMTADTYYTARRAEDKRYRTNFSPDFFEMDSPESQKHIQRGRIPPGEPKWERVGSGSSSWVVSELERSQSNVFGGAFDNFALDRKDPRKFQKYNSLVKYLEQTC